MIGMVMTSPGSTVASAMDTVVALAHTTPDNNNISNPIENVLIFILFINFFLLIFKRNMFY